MPGFVPVNYNKTGKALFVLGLMCLIGKLLDYLTNWFIISNYFLYLGLALVLISLYLIFIVPKA